MIHKFPLAAVVAFACAAVATAKDEPKEVAVEGVVKKLDAFDLVNGTMTVTVAKGKATEDKVIELLESAKVVIHPKGVRTVLNFSDGMRSKELVEGVRVRFVTDKAGKVTELQVDPPKKDDK